MSRIAIVDRKRCSPENCGHFLCQRVCPVNRKGEDCITESESHKAEIDEGLCIGCSICVKKCPFDAIEIINLPEELDKPPIHNFGKNGFHLYNLPNPVFGKVTGIIGRNGIGKSTAINILSGILKPNLGEEGKEAELSELIEYFKGSELHNYFERLHGGEISVSVKPQQVSLLPKAYKGTVKELLKKRDEKSQLKEVCERLQLNKILDRKLNQISGGELQRVAIAATVLKKANVYFFDEPSSYLDIKQRILVSQFIKELANEDTAIIVIEHDLIILDYMTDYIHVTFGQPAGYGVVSTHKATKEGINEYLHGFLRKENMRFRQHEITFDDKPPGTKNKTEPVVQWENVSVKLGNFTLEAKGGAVHKKHVVGILGENGTGKTTFVKVLADEIALDKGEVKGNIVVSYKPQYIDTDSDETVRVFLKEAVSKFMNELVNPLELEKVLDEPLKSLSGGELQRVMIAKCLSQQADLYLLDEPSAYLDVEQRLHTSKIIGKLMDLKGKTALIVDHDILFIDYLSEDLIVVDGTPAELGSLNGPFPMEEGMNHFLTNLSISMRRDQGSRRPRINSKDSRLDREQKSTGHLYYA